MRQLAWKRNRFGNYIVGMFAIVRLPNGKWQLWKKQEPVGVFPTMKEADQAAAAILEVEEKRKEVLCA